ncbi:MAG: ethanolamine ammonia-lyase reactivating factor EutA, partial [Burkholderiales bacterium]
MRSLQRAHEGDEPHFHEWSQDERQALARTIWNAENVELTTVGIDIGSSTSHLMFARVHLQRKTQLLSSEFAVVRRDILWRSPILFTPFLADFTIDAARLRAFVDAAYAQAGIAPEQVDCGAVILTGEAIKRTNAQAIAAIFASQAGRFVCASAGHHMECVLAAHGAGAVAISRHTHKTVLNVDIGGGTTKFALIENGEIRATCAVAVGGRLMPAAAQRCEELAQVVLSVIRGDPPAGLARQLLLTAPLEWRRPHLVTFSGGVAEYIFGREARTFGDIAQPLAARIVQGFADGRVDLPMMDPGQGIRATVIGASQFSVQLSGNTIHLSDKAQLPVRNVPVLFPALDFEGGLNSDHIARAITAALARADLREELHAQVRRSVAAG